MVSPRNDKQDQGSSYRTSNELAAQSRRRSVARLYLCLVKICIREGEDELDRNKFDENRPGLHGRTEGPYVLLI